jgi:L-alanine-DL-glutamate epimerase-like enolase superfamily enzyme
MAALASFHGVRVVPHVCAGPISLAANLHLAASVPNILAIEYPPSLLAAWEALGTGAPLGLEAIVDGELPIPRTPGLGVALDESVAAAHPYRVPRRLAGTAGRADDPRTGWPDRFVGDR